MRVLDHIQHWITISIDWLFDHFQIGGSHKNRCLFQSLILLVNLSFCVHPVLCYIGIQGNVHVAFWMGQAPSRTCLLVPALMFIMNIGVGFVQLARGGRKSVRGGLVALLAIIAVPLMGAGVYVMILSHHVSAELMNHCGQGPMTAKIQNEWNKLKNFHEACSERAGDKTIYIQQCPGFEKESRSNFYAQYMENMEYDYACQGFCALWEHPLFNRDSEFGSSCADAVGEEMLHTGYIVGAPTAATGFWLLLCAACLLGYNHL